MYVVCRNLQSQSVLTLFDYYVIKVSYHTKQVCVGNFNYCRCVLFRYRKLEGSHCHFVIFFGADWMASMSSPIRSTFYWLLFTLYIDWFWWSTHWDDFFSDHVDPNPIKIDWVLHQYLSQLVVLVTLWYHFLFFLRSQTHDSYKMATLLKPKKNRVSQWQWSLFISILV